jgi:hypothetical protein
MKRYKEKEVKKYVIADLSLPTNYLFSLRGAKYCFIDNIATCTKFVSRKVAQEICNECIRNFGIDLVVVPIVITYEIVEE